MRWTNALIEVFGVAVIGIGASAIWGHVYELERLYNWNGAKAAMGLSSAVAFTLTGIVLALIGWSLDVIWLRMRDW